VDLEIAVRDDRRIDGRRIAIIVHEDERAAVRVRRIRVDLQEVAVLARAVALPVAAGLVRSSQRPKKYTSG